MSKSCRNTFLSDVVLGKYVQSFVVFLSQRVNDSPSRQATAPCTCKAWQLHRAWTKAHWVAVCKFGTLPLSLTLEILLHIFRKTYRQLKRWHLPMTPCKESGILRNLALPFMLQCYTGDTRGQGWHPEWRFPGDLGKGCADVKCNGSCEGGTGGKQNQEGFSHAPSSWNRWMLPFLRKKWVLPIGSLPFNTAIFHFHD